MNNEALRDDLDDVERYELHEPPRYQFDVNRYRFDVTRREFVQVLGAGLVVSIAARQSTGQDRNRGRSGGRERAPSERFHIGVDGVVTVLTSKVECGQGSRTQLTQAAAEELQLPIERVRLIMADTGLCPDDGGTAGSRTTPSTVPQVRHAAAALRTILIELAAGALAVEPGTVTTKEDRFVASSGKQISLGELAKLDGFQTRLDAPRPAGVAVKRVEEWNVLGTAVPKVNGREVVTGAAVYPSDIARPQMLYGKVLRPIAYGATLKSVDAAAAKQIEGVKVVQDGGFVGCAADSTWTAAKAIDALAATAQWEKTPHPSSDELFEHLRRTAQTANTGRSRPRENAWGNREPALAAATNKASATYTVAYIQHAPMEPRAAVASWADDGSLTVWTGTQQPSRVRSELAGAFRIPESRVRVIVPDTGGGFGGKHTGEVAVEAARLAKAAKRPVSLRWTREEEFTWAYFRPAGVIDVQAGLDAAGKLVAWDFTNFNSGGSAIDTPYRVPNGRTRFVGADSPLRQGSYRALASTANTFARESMMDELAEIAKADPLEFRLAHLPDGRLRDVLVDAASKFDWAGQRRGQAKGRGVGLACGTEKASYVAACAQVEVANGNIRVLSICQAYECGAIQNPRNLRAQVEGCIVMGLGGALSEEVRFKDGVVQNANFSGYAVPRMRDLPPLDIVLRNRPDLESVGAGETPIIAVAPAIANAVFHATGQRIRSMPLKVT